MTTINVKDASGLVVPLEKPLVPGQTIMANSRPVVIAVDQSPVPVGGSVSITGTIASTQSGAWVVRNQDGVGNALTSATRGAERALSVQIVDGSGNQVTTFGGAGGTSSNIGSAIPTAATATGYSDGVNMRLPVVIDGDTGGGTQWIAGVIERVPASGGSIGKSYSSGLVDNGTQRVWIASDQSPLTVLQGNYNGGTPWQFSLVNSSITLPTNNTAAWDKNLGAASAATQRICIASDQVGPLVNNSVPTVSGGFNYKPAPASATTTMGTTGAVGDYIEGLICVVTTTGTSQVQIADGNGSLMIVLPNNVGGGIGSYYVPLGLKAINVGPPVGWRVTCGAGVAAIGTGAFT